MKANQKQTDTAGSAPFLLAASVAGPAGLLLGRDTCGQQHAAVGQGQHWYGGRVGGTPPGTAGRARGAAATPGRWGARMAPWRSHGMRTVHAGGLGGAAHKRAKGTFVGPFGSRKPPVPAGERSHKGTPQALPCAHGSTELWRRPSPWDPRMLPLLRRAWLCLGALLVAPHVSGAAVPRDPHPHCLWWRFPLCPSALLPLHGGAALPTLWLLRGAGSRAAPQGKHSCPLLSPQCDLLHLPAAPRPWGGQGPTARARGPHWAVGVQLSPTAWRRRGPRSC